MIDPPQLNDTIHPDHLLRTVIQARAKAAVAQQAAHAKREKAKLRRKTKGSDGPHA